MIKSILITSENYYPVGGGVEQFIRGLAEYLTERGYNVWIYTKNYPDKNLQGEYKFKEGNIVYSKLMEGSLGKPFKVIRHHKEFADFIKEKKIDLVFANNHNSLAWIKAAKLAKVPVIYGCHGVGLMCPLKIRFLKPNEDICWEGLSFKGCNECLTNLMEKNKYPLWKKIAKHILFSLPNRFKNNYWQYKEALRILNSADGRYGNSSMTANLFKESKNTFGFPLAINASNPNFSNYYFPERDEVFLKKYGLEYKKYILCPGRIHQIKGQKYAILALKYLTDSKLKLVLAGNSFLFEGRKFDFNDYANELKEIVKKNNLRERTIFTGLLDFEEMRKIYGGALVTVIPSIWFETFGYVTLESMACGTPVIITRNCGSSECIDNNCGFLIERKNEKQIAEVINRNIGKFEEMGKKAREKVLKNYDWSILGPKIIEMLNRVYFSFYG